MKDRLELFLKTYSLNYAKLAEIMDVAPARVSHIMTGRNNPSYDFIETMLVKFPEINPDWLILGKGNMLRGDENNTEPQPLDHNVRDKPQTALPFVQQELFAETETHALIQHKDKVHNRAQSADQSLKNNAPPSPNKSGLSTALSDIEQNEAHITQFKTPTNKTISKIVVFYSDKTFSEYNPSSNE